MKPKKDKRYRLWTFQSVRSVAELESKGIIEASWDRYAKTYDFLKAYRWMARQMAIKKTSCNNNAPVWAWHSCGKYEAAPKLVDARSLLSDVELENGIQTIEFECPAEVVLLSNYGVWNMMLHEIFPDMDETDIDEKVVNELFETSRRKYRQYDIIQAVLPYLKMEWVKEIRELNLKPGDFSYDPEENV
jgi:hypothetical protein